MARVLRLLDAHGNPMRGQAPRVRARYDAATASPEDARHWSMADTMSARAANSKDVRERLRIRARYEVANNSYAAGIVSTLANDMIGTGPRLQMLTEDEGQNRTIEREFSRWMCSVRLAEKLRTMRRTLAVDGEPFALFTSNPEVEGDVKLDLRLIEADQFTTPFPNPSDPLQVDGIRYDTHGNPVEYTMLKYHPGEIFNVGYETETVRARDVIHWFRMDRPGQCRGIPEVMPALPLFAFLRRYTLAVVGAAETAADFAAVVYSALPPDEGGIQACEPFEALEIERRMMTTLPQGWQMSQFKPEQPATTYGDFKSEILKEIARCLNVPYNVAAGDSSNYNYASSRMDRQNYNTSIMVDRNYVDINIMDRILKAWIDEASLATDFIRGSDPLEGWPHRWFWPGFSHVDPMKEATAQSKRLQSNTTTLANEYAQQGMDWEVQLRQRARELALMAELGIPIVYEPTPVGVSVPEPSSPVPDYGDPDEEGD